LASSSDWDDCAFQKEETMASDAAWDKALADAKKVLGNSARARQAFDGYPEIQASLITPR
jgi:hypothetical protein